MKSNSYMTRALQAKDPRFARILGKLGYSAEKPVKPEKAEDEDDLAELRAEYQEKIGKKPYHGWDADTLREKMAGGDD